MKFDRAINVVGVHAEGEVGHVITGGFRPVKGKTMIDRLAWMVENHDDFRRFMLQEPRGTANHNVNLVLPPATEDGDFGMLVMESEDYAPMSGSNTMCTTTAVLETGMFPMVEPETFLKIDTAAGRVNVRAECSGGKVQRVTLTNVPCFVFDLDREFDIPGTGKIVVDFAWGGMVYGFVNAEDLGIEIISNNGKELVRLAEIIKRHIRQVYTPVHPEEPMFAGLQCLTIIGPIYDVDGVKTSKNATCVSPGRLDRSPCGTGTSARLAVMHAKGLIKKGEIFNHLSTIGTSFINRIEETTTVAGIPAIIPSISGRAWITGFMQYMLDPTDPFPSGFRCGDQWGAPSAGSNNKPQVRSSN